MTATHTIRLRGPWDYQPLAHTLMLPDGTTAEEPGPLPPPGKTAVPSDWGATLGADFRGRVRYTRRFHRPTGLDQRERVWLVVEQVDAAGDASLNGSRLGALGGDRGSARFDITDLLQPSNLLTIEVELPRAAGRSPDRPSGRDGLPGGLVGEVRLEIG